MKSENIVLGGVVGVVLVGVVLVGVALVGVVLVVVGLELVVADIVTAAVAITDVAPIKLSSSHCLSPRMAKIWKIMVGKNKRS